VIEKIFEIKSWAVAAGSKLAVAGFAPTGRVAAGWRVGLGYQRRL
jgi:hypothetical protein